MSTIAAKFSAASMQFKVGTAAVALVAAATITPAIAEAAPDFASIPLTSVGAAAGDTVIPGGFITTYLENDGPSTAAVEAGPPIFSPIGAVVDFAFQAVGGVVWVALKAIEAGASFIGATVVAESFGQLANATAFFFKVGPYAD
jgi:hypothetical protein